MTDSAIETCYCTDKTHKHENALICGKPLSAKTAAEVRKDKQDFEDYKLGLCDECGEKLQKAKIGA